MEDQPVDFNERSREKEKCMTVEVFSSEEEHDFQYSCDRILYGCSDNRFNICLSMMDAK